MVFGAIYIAISIFQVENVRLKLKRMKKSMNFFFFSFFRQGLHHFDINLLVVCSLVVNSILTVLPYCYFASTLIDRLEKMPTQIFISNWHLLSLTQQKKISLMIGFAQRRRRFSGYGMITCSMETFLKVFVLFTSANNDLVMFYSYLQIMKTTISYYLLFKKFSE